MREGERVQTWHGGYGGEPATTRLLRVGTTVRFLLGARGKIV